MYLFVGLFMAVLQGGLVRRIKSGKESAYALIVSTCSHATCCINIEHLTNWHFFTQGMFCIIPSFVIIGCATVLTQLYGGLVFYAFASATIVPCLTTIASSYGPSDQKGTTLGIFRSLGALARALGPLFASIGIQMKLVNHHCQLTLL